MRLFTPELIVPRRRLFIPSKVAAGNPPAFKSIGSRLAGSSSTTAAVPVPANVAADNLILIHLYASGASAPSVTSVPSGFDLATDSPQTIGGVRSWVYKKIATGNDTGTYDFILSGLLWRTAYAACYENVDTANPIDITDGAAATTQAYPDTSLTTSGDNRLVVWLGANYGGDGSITTTPPAGWSVRANTNTDATLVVCDKPFATQGSTGTISASASSGTDAKTAWLGALKP